MNGTGRNDPWPCGSGRKFKKCCLPQQETARPGRVRAGTPEPFITELRPDLDDAVDVLLQRLEAGEGKGVRNDIVALYERHAHYHMTNYGAGQGRLRTHPAGGF